MVAEYRPSSLDTSHHRKANGEACSSASGTLRKKRGLRISEALALTREDVDLRNGLLTIRGAKFGKTRLVPLHPSACRALSRYAQQRDELLSVRRVLLTFCSARAADRPKSPRFVVSFINSRVKRGCGVRRIAAALACKTFAIAARRRSCSSGIRRGECRAKAAPHLLFKRLAGALP